ncbi:hypothetical protein [Xanthomonas campestris]|uniref:hypothetical protein n=1 Tax=Xanthomonas campestris TaxID=339 RepID=UPI0023788938|nr:hypothetical protein [Xanthomonas campestris]
MRLFSHRMDEKMDCLLKFTFSNILKNIIQKLVDDKNCYGDIVRTEEWGLVMHLDKTIKKRKMCERPCLGCLEFARIGGMFGKLTNEIAIANSEHKPLLECLCQTFEIDGEVDSITLALDLTSAPDYVKSKIKKDLIINYEKYEASINGAFRSLALDHYMHEQAKYSDTLMSNAELENNQKISYIPFIKRDDQKSFYLDQNIISKCINDSSFRKQVIDFRQKAMHELVCSPYVIEDGIKMSRVRLAEYFSAISDITGGSMLVNIDGEIRFARENIDITSKRVLLWRDATRAAEDNKFYKLQYNHWGYPHYAKKSSISRCINSDIHGFFESLRPHVENDQHELSHDDFESSYAIYRRLHAATIGKTFSLDELIHGSIVFNSDQECVKHIEGICELLDLVNYRTEQLSAPQKIRSSLQDVEHLKYAWKADYFVTEDNRLRDRGEFIYSALKLNTKFINLAGLKAEIIAAFKN